MLSHKHLSDRTENALRAGLLTTSIVVCLGLAEGVLRWVDARPVSAVHLSDRGVTTALDCYPSNPRGYFDLDLRDAATRERYRSRRVRDVDDQAAAAPFAIELRYNRMQFRDRDFSVRTAPRRVAIVGDSFTEGQGVRERDVLPRVLERVLNAAEPGRWEVLNVGRRGADFPALSGSFGQALDLQPDLVVYAMMLNDPETTAAFRERHAFLYERLARGWHRRGEPPSLFRLVSFVGSRLDAARVERETTRWYRELYGPENRAGWQRTQEHLAEMDRRASDRGIGFLVAVWPVLAGLEDDYPFESAHLAVARVCERLRIPRHDLLPVMRGHAASALWVHATDRHPNEAAHALAARSLAPAVRAYWAGS
jgi:hypothetical protein